MSLPFSTMKSTLMPKPSLRKPGSGVSASLRLARPRAAQGWRAELVGGPAERLVAGELALLTSTMLRMKEEALTQANHRIAALTAELEAMRAGKVAAR